MERLSSAAVMVYWDWRWKGSVDPLQRTRLYICWTLFYFTNQGDRFKRMSRGSIKVNQRYCSKGYGRVNVSHIFERLVEKNAGRNSRVDDDSGQSALLMSIWMTRASSRGVSSLRVSCSKETILLSWEVVVTWCAISLTNSWQPLDGAITWQHPGVTWIKLICLVGGWGAIFQIVVFLINADFFVWCYLVSRADHVDIQGSR